jgi:tRNA-specific 2-thiouridylase
MGAPDLGVAPGARVVVAMSGGVDSSVVAALYACAGCEVVGVTLQLYDHGAAVRRPGACCAGADIHDARRVADALGIAHYVLDFEARFRAAVIDDFADAYAAGLTPIPCVRCNQRVKFADLMDIARSLGAQALATGHYARRVAGSDGAALHRARERGRDQSYFLFATTRDQLDYVRFPLGDLTKNETRAIGAALGLAVAGKPDSQDICFVPEGRYADVVRRIRPDTDAPGAIVDRQGRELGRHDGIVDFTIGQRRGLGVAAPEPLYVVGLDPASRQVTVGPRAALERRRVVLDDLNWLGEGPGPSAGAHVGLRVRSTREPAPATVAEVAPGRLVVDLDRADGAIAPGQAGVLYDGDRVLGGGWIARESPARAAG